MVHQYVQLWSTNGVNNGPFAALRLMHQLIIYGWLLMGLGFLNGDVTIDGEQGLLFS